MTDDYLVCDDERKFIHLSRWVTGMSPSQLALTERFLARHHGHSIRVVAFEDFNEDGYTNEKEADEAERWSAVEGLPAGTLVALLTDGAGRAHAGATNVVGILTRAVEQGEDVRAALMTNGVIRGPA